MESIKHKIQSKTISYCQKLGILSPLLLSKMIYLLKFKKFPNLKNPTNLNEKILHLEFFTDTTRWSELSDKSLVRNYIKEKGLEKYLVKQYGTWNNAEDIDFDYLPNQFVLKTNHGYGDVIIVNDKTTINKAEIINSLNKSLKRKFGYTTGEPHYTRISPRIIAEELLEKPTSQRSIIDYKFWCFNGKPNNCLVCSNRNIKEHKVNIGYYSINPWHKCSEKIHPTFKNDDIVECPKNLNEMLQVCTILAADFPLVRIDLYNVNGKIYFGEMTFSSNGGRMRYYTDETLVEMGMQVKL